MMCFILQAKVHTKKSPLERFVPSSFIEEWNQCTKVEVEHKAQELGSFLINAIRQGKDDEFIPFTGHKLSSCTKYCLRQI
ncbi:MAG: hypothetical protein ACJ70R_00640 [Nitrososphaera sp.]